MAKTATVTLGGTEYTVRPFNLDELQEVGEIVGDGSAASGNTAIRILKVALRRATPTVPDGGKIEIESFQEVSIAAKTILGLAGLKTDENPPAAAPAV